MTPGGDGFQDYSAQAGADDVVEGLAIPGLCKDILKDTCWRREPDMEVGIRDIRVEDVNNADHPAATEM